MKSQGDEITGGGPRRHGLIDRNEPLRESPRTAGISVTAPLELKIRFEHLAIDYKSKYGHRITLESLYLIALEQGIPSFEDLESLLAEQPLR